MKKHFLFCVLVFSLYKCIGIQKVPKTENFVKFDPICGDSVLWHLHFQEGFLNDNIKVVFGQDTSEVKKLSSDKGNGCTPLYISLYKRYGKYYFFTKYMPEFNQVTELKKINSDDSIKVVIIINETPFSFNEGLNYFRFYGINFSKKNNNISYLHNTNCFSCQ